MHVAVVAGAAVYTNVALEYDFGLADMDPADLLYHPSPLGLTAVEEALRMRERLGAGSVTVFAAGTRGAKAALRSYLAMGADEAVHLCDRALDQADAYLLSLCLAAAIKRVRSDLVICEGHSMDQRGSSQYLGPYLAEMLALPHISGVTRVELDQEGRRLVVHRRLARGDREILACPVRCLLAVEMEINEPRYPSLPCSLQAAERTITSQTLQQLELGSRVVGGQEGLVQLVQVSTRRARVKKGLVIDPTLSAAERIRLTMAGGAVSKGTRQTLITGGAEEAAEQILKVAVQQGLVVRGPAKEPTDRSSQQACLDGGAG